jgi:transcriptional regulator with XRE-family HTH domain
MHKRFPELIKEARKSKGWSQKVLAEKINATSGYIANLENNRILPSYKKSIVLANTLDIPLKIILEEIKEEKLLNKINRYKQENILNSPLKLE